MALNKTMFWCNDDLSQWFFDPDQEWLDLVTPDQENKIVRKTLEPTKQSEIFDRLLAYLPPVFRTESGKSTAFYLRCSRSFSYEIKDCFFKTFLEGSFIPDLVIDLREITIGELIFAILENGNYLVEINKHEERSALCLIDTYHEDNSDGAVYIFTNSLWGVYKALSIEFQAAYGAMLELQRQLSLVGATGIVEDYWGSFFDVVRREGETDAQYAQRIVWTLKLPKSNNTGMEIILQEFLGIKTRIVDLGYVAANSIMLMNTVVTPMGDLRFPLWMPISSQQSEPCTFGIYLLDRVLAMLNSDQIASIRELVYSMKEAGTRPKLIWSGVPLIMLMNDVGTPFGQQDYPLWYGVEYKNGYSSLFL